jgi:hypothetical protein
MTGLNGIVTTYILKNQMEVNEKNQDRASIGNDDKHSEYMCKWSMYQCNVIGPENSVTYSLRTNANGMKLSTGYWAAKYRVLITYILGTYAKTIKL